MNTRHVPDLEHCQELDRLCKEKGIVVPETDMYWQTYPEGETRLVTGINSFANPKNIHVPAPLVSELGEWLPETVFQTKEDGMFMLRVCEKEIATKIGNVTEANARQSMLLYLIREDIITKL